jgi:methyltransferase-like protein
MENATKRGLQYLGDASVSSMFVGNMPASVSEKLKTINDVVRIEQYMDFINNRRFRSTILCKNTVQINRSLDLSGIKKFYLGIKLAAEKAITDIDLNDATTSAQFYLNGNKDSSISTSSPRMKAILYTFAENWNHLLSFDDVVKLSMKKLPQENKEAIEAELLNNGMRMVLSGYISLSSEKPLSVNKIAAKPKVSNFVSWQAKNINGLWVTNEMHDRLAINILEKIALRYMDGKNSVEKIVEHILEHVSNNEITLSKDGQKIEDKEQIKEEINKALTQSLERLKSSAIFI